MLFDHVGPLITSTDGFKYILSIQETLSRKIWLYAVKSREATEVAFTLAGFTAANGVPSEFISDNAAEYRSQIIQQLTQTFGCQQKFTLSFQARQNLIERSHSFIHGCLTKTLIDHTQWPKYLVFVESCYNNSVHSATKMTPNFVFFGRHLQMPTQGILSQPPCNGEIQNGFLSEFVEQLRNIHQQARTNLKAAAERNERIYNAARRNPVFQTGQLVLVFSARKRKNQYPKWCQYWGLQAIVERRLNGMLYLIRYQNKPNRTQIVHVDKMRAVPNSESIEHDE
jgi:hypothetical protein